MKKKDDMFFGCRCLFLLQCSCFCGSFKLLTNSKWRVNNKFISSGKGWNSSLLFALNRNNIITYLFHNCLFFYHQSFSSATLFLKVIWLSDFFSEDDECFKGNAAEFYSSEKKLHVAPPKLLKTKLTNLFSITYIISENVNPYVQCTNDRKLLHFSVGSAERQDFLFWRKRKVKKFNEKGHHPKGICFVSCQ